MQLVAQHQFNGNSATRKSASEAQVNDFDLEKAIRGFGFGVGATFTTRVRDRLDREASG